MALLERVSTLLRANLNDLIDRAENPGSMLKQVILDMENQLIQVKTQVAIAAADLHVLERKREETVEKEAAWMRKAHLALDKKDDTLARAAVERALESRKMIAAFEQQIADQKVQVENLKGAFGKLESKLADARTRAEVLVVRHRRARASGAAAQAQSAADPASALRRMGDKVAHAEGLGQALTDILHDDLDDRLAALEKDDEAGKLLAELKSQRDVQR